MGNSHRRLFLHLVWSTYKRTPFISKNIKPELYKYIGSLIKEKNSKLIAIGGIEDHVHILIKTEFFSDIPKLVRRIKSCTSTFMKKAKPSESFAWQVGYASFTVSPTALKRAIQYINNQEERHKNSRFEEELKNLLNL